MFKNRSVVEIMVITFVFVVAFAMLSTGAMITIVEIRDPTADTRAAVTTLFTAITIVLGALLGLLAGKSDSIERLGTRPDKTHDDVAKTSTESYLDPEKIEDHPFWDEMEKKNKK